MSDSFSYTSFTVSADRLSVSLHYDLTHDDTTTHLTEAYGFAQALPDCYETNQLLRALHLTCGVSYYKTFLPPTITQPYQMDEAEAAFWNGVYRGGLGEFLYINQINPSRLAQFGVQSGTFFKNSGAVTLHPTALLGIGGGKDSILAGEALLASDVSLEGFVMATGEALGQASDVAKVMQIPLNVISRQFDTQLIDLQEQPGAFKGHIPISLIFALVGSLLAVSRDSAYVIVANEDSASIPRAEWAGEPVNHQWSKSFEFEQALQDYLHVHVSEQLTYFSAVRPLGSVGIAKAFATLPQYFEVFTSDNSVFRIDPAMRPNARWSLESPKSLSSFILLSPWLDEEVMVRIFGRNFMDEAGLQPLFLALVGIQGEPPLDCVGTPEELAASLMEARAQGKWQGSALLALPELESLQAAPLDDYTHMSGHQYFPPPLAHTLTETLKDMIS